MMKISASLVLAALVSTCGNPADRDAAVEEQAMHTAAYGPAVQGLQIKARPFRTVVPPEGPLWVEITVRNMADSTVTFRPIFTAGAWLRADITGPDGQEVPKTASIDPPNAWAVSLDAGESVTDTVDLLCPVPGPTRADCVPPYDLSGSGEYDVRLRFHLPPATGPTSVVMIEAEPFTVQIKEDGRL